MPITATAQFGAPMMFAGKSGAGGLRPSLTAVTLSNNSFNAGATDGTVVGGITVQGTGNIASATLSISGADSNAFRVSSTTVPSNLLINGSQCTTPPVTYNINIVAILPGATNSPLARAKTITCSTLAAGFHVATTGNDSNPGTLASPFLTLPRCQTAMQGSVTKTCYIHGGTYNITAFHAVFGTSFGVYLTSAADNGETWQYYPPDGYNSAIIDGGSTGCEVNGIKTLIGIDGGSNITVNGLQFQHYQYYGVGVHGGLGYEVEWPVDTGVANGNTIKNNIMHDNTCSGTSFGPAACITNAPNCTITHNAAWNLQGPGFGGGYPSNTNGTNNLNNLSVSWNYVQNGCLGSGDCSALGGSDWLESSTNIVFKNNYIRDWKDYTGNLANKALYGDDGTSNKTWQGNIITGHGGTNGYCFFVHGGHDITFKENICDIPDSMILLGYQDSGLLGCEGSPLPSFCMKNNVISNNIYVGANSGSGYVVQSGGATTPNPAIVSNAYFKYTGGTINSGGLFGDGGCVGGHNTIGGACVAGDQNPTNLASNPFLTCPNIQGFPGVDSWSFKINPVSPVFGTPVNFPAQGVNDNGVAYGMPGYWGPPGFVLPHVGTAPSYGPTC